MDYLGFAAYKDALNTADFAVFPEGFKKDWCDGKNVF